MKGTFKTIISLEGGFLNFLRPLMTASLLLMKNELTPLAKSVLVPLGLTTTASTKDVALQKKVFGSGTALIFSNEDLNDIMKIVKSLEESVYW